jgi:hypothetical protein
MIEPYKNADEAAQKARDGFANTSERTRHLMCLEASLDAGTISKREFRSLDAAAFRHAPRTTTRVSEPNPEREYLYYESASGMGEEMRAAMNRAQNARRRACIAAEQLPGPSFSDRVWKFLTGSYE